MTPSASLYVPEEIRTGSPTAYVAWFIPRTLPGTTWFFKSKYLPSTQFDLIDYLCLRQDPLDLGVFVLRVGRSFCKSVDALQTSA
jgi:hypothetical protein